MEKEEMLEQTNKTENVDTQTTEEIEEGIELTDTSETENVEEKAKSLKELLEENPDYQEQFNNMMKIRLGRQKREHEREISRYKNTENLLNAGLGTDNLADAETNLRKYWEEEGIKLPTPQRPDLTDREIEVLAKAEADEILELGIEDAKEEANKLASRGYKNLNRKEQVIFDTLSKSLMYENNKKELINLGVKPSLLEDTDFKKFADMFSTKTPIKDIVNLYNKNNKKNYEKMGSMKTTQTEKVKDDYTEDEIRKLSLDDLDDDKVWEAVRKSMTSR